MHLNPLPRRVSVRATDLNGDLIRGASFDWFVNGEPAGNGKRSQGFSTIEVDNAKAVISVSSSFAGMSKGPVKLAPEQQDYTFQYDVEVHSRWTSFLQQHFPALIGIVFILVGVALAFRFDHPNEVQRRVLLGTFALGGGGFGGEIAGLINVDLTFGRKVAITAGGAMAIFVLLYFFGPGD